VEGEVGVSWTVHSSCPGGTRYFFMGCQCGSGHFPKCVHVSFRPLQDSRALISHYRKLYPCPGESSYISTVCQNTSALCNKLGKLHFQITRPKSIPYWRGSLFTTSEPHYMEWTFKRIASLKRRNNPKNPVLPVLEENEWLQTYFYTPRMKA
jgi:hypothetical protein